MSKRKNIIEYISEVSVKHNNYYDYSLVDYKNAHTKIKIICPIHGIFEQTPINHKRYGCKKCGRLLNDSEVLDRFKQMHGNKYDYSNFKYSGMYSKSTIKCFIHGEFEQTSLNHLLGKGCPRCAKNYKKNATEIINKLKIIHNNKYDYSLIKFDVVKDVVTILCPKHKEFKQTLNNHLSGHGCPFCNDSKGERFIEKYLIDNNILFERQKKFAGCRDKNQLPFDFYLVEYNVCIEYDGEQHFFDVLNWNNLRYTKLHDTIKDKFCEENNIILYRISYKDNIINILKKLKIT